MKILDELRTISEQTYNPFLKDEKAAGKPLIGYFCPYLPEELLHAAGMVPCRINAVGSRGTAKGDIYFSPINCSYVRHIFDKVLNREYDFLDGVIFTNGCDHNKRLYDNWRDARGESGLPPDFLYMFEVPHMINDRAETKLNREILKLISTLEQMFSVKIEESAVSASIAIYNRKRRLMKEIFGKRGRLETKVSGSDMLRLMLAATVIPVEAACDLLARLNESLGDPPEKPEGRPRILLTGGCFEEPDLIDMIEECGGEVVADTFCHGMRYFDMEVDESAPPLEALAARYLCHASCPRMINDFYRRMDSLQQTMLEYSVDAVIVEKLMFCDLWGGENFLLHQESKRLGFPILTLDRELYSEGKGQRRTRLQAFFEQLANARGTA